MPVIRGATRYAPGREGFLPFVLGADDADGGGFDFGGDFFGGEAVAGEGAGGGGDVVLGEELADLAGGDGQAVAVLEGGVGGLHGDDAHDVAVAVEHGPAGVAGVDLGVGAAGDAAVGFVVGGGGFGLGGDADDGEGARGSADAVLGGEEAGGLHHGLDLGGVAGDGGDDGDAVDEVLAEGLGVAVVGGLVE